MIITLRALVEQGVRNRSGRLRRPRGSCAGTRINNEHPGLSGGCGENSNYSALSSRVFYLTSLLSHMSLRSMDMRSFAVTACGDGWDPNYCAAESAG